ncbi:MAG: transporter permease [Conexibacter sp.]|jgi:branched-chain amino acid transport system permease protein|nr:transporter permease [Conexibacter sp.]MCZ4492593.1 transporter permease [Conexibacter sp.]MDX6714656.1 branched-chain amino acid transport system permease protein [Baekduia sp.]MDX6733776.1 branched-chain amino acid transport system permease protein [Baekduia sp.]
MQQVVNTIVTASVYAMFALGFNLVLGGLNILNLAQGALFALAAVVAYEVTHGGSSIWVGLVVAALAAAAVSLAINELTLAPLRRRGGAGFLPMVASLGASLIIVALLREHTGAQVLSLPSGALPQGIHKIGSVTISDTQLLAVGAAAVVYGVTALVLTRSSIGRAVRATEFDEDAARMIGLPTESLIRLMFLMSGLFAGVAGVVTAILYSTVSYSMGDEFLLAGFVVVVLGGFGSVPGTLLASVVLAAIQVGSVSAGLSDYSNALAFGLLIVMLMVRPTGFFGAPIAARP